MDSAADNLDQQTTQKYRRALSAGVEELFQLLLDQDMGVLKVVLKNPFFGEDHLLTLLKRRDLSEELLSHIYRLKRPLLTHRLQLAIVKNPATPGPLIRSLLPHLRLFELLDLCILPGSTPDQKLAAERAILQRLATTPLGNKITLARRGTATIVGELLKEGHPQICEACLSSPHLKEAAVFQFLRGSTANGETISMIARHNRWKQRSNIRMAVLKNPRTPEIWLTLWLPQLNLPLLKQLQLTFKTLPTRKRLIDRELKKRGAV
ncbi:MAG: hypothetical protein JXQ81_13095 [Desulfuromonadales bacterium]|nr:hypothetical protein [Desulfuromonadales bacterium]MBN2793440.1 hypothetical protein [Desulfuromonadales bacterium]